MARTATVERNTLETRIRVSVNLDGTGKSQFDTGVPFLEHMMDQIARHGLIDLDIFCKGDLHIDDHHTVEDIGITLGQAFAEAIGDKKGIVRYGHSYVPLDEALSRVVIDFSGRPGLSFNCDFTRASIGKLDTQLFWEFFQGFVNHAVCTLITSRVLTPTTRLRRFSRRLVGRCGWRLKWILVWRALCHPLKALCNILL